MHHRNNDSHNDKLRNSFVKIPMSESSIIYKYKHYTSGLQLHSPCRLTSLIIFHAPLQPRALRLLIVGQFSRSSTSEDTVLLLMLRNVIWYLVVRRKSHATYLVPNWYIIRLTIDHVFFAADEGNKINITAFIPIPVEQQKIYLMCH